VILRCWLNFWKCNDAEYCRLGTLSFSFYNASAVFPVRLKNHDSKFRSSLALERERTVFNWVFWTPNLVLKTDSKWNQTCLRKMIYINASNIYDWTWDWSILLFVIFCVNHGIHEHLGIKSPEIVIIDAITCNDIHEIFFFIEKKVLEIAGKVIVLASYFKNLFFRIFLSYYIYH